jgi:hypothetical protein
MIHVAHSSEVRRIVGPNALVEQSGEHTHLPLGKPAVKILRVENSGFTAKAAEKEDGLRRSAEGQFPKIPFIGSRSG